MKARHFCFLFSALGYSAHAQYSVDWSKVAGGGGMSTGGVYSVHGTIGQPDAGGSTLLSKLAGDPG